MTGHLVPRKVYYMIFTTLLALTALTVAVSYVDLGPMNSLVAMTIACVKATLVVLYFMHARYSERLTHVVIASSLVFLAILVFLLLADYVSRPWSLVAAL